ncbi:MAG: LuxR C-terminal-related transcriptional regulator [Chloroflexaceae bacterium]
MSDTTPVRVLTIDSLPLVHAGVRQLLATFPDMHVVGGAFDLNDALQLGAACAPRVVLTEIQDFGPEWPAALRRLAAVLRVPVVVFTLEANVEQVRQALGIGVQGYLLKNTQALALAQALRSIVAGQQVFAPEIMVSTFSARPDLAGEMLTRREREVLMLLARGLSNDEIGARLCVSRATVKFHCGQIFAKLGVQSRPRLLLWPTATTWCHG